MSSADCAVAGPRRVWEDEAAAEVSDEVAVRPSLRTEVGSDESCCSWAAGPVATLSTGNGEREEHRCPRASSGRRAQQGLPGAQHELGERPP